jgi:cyclopropane-fatty-acyl-phospholipid synthase
MAQIACAGGQFVVEAGMGFGPDYDRTLLAWHQRFNTTWPDISARYGERFHRMWNFWLLASAAYFRARRDQLWQLVLSPQGCPGAMLR